MLCLWNMRRQYVTINISKYTDRRFIDNYIINTDICYNMVTITGLCLGKGNVRRAPNKSILVDPKHPFVFILSISSNHQEYISFEYVIHVWTRIECTELSKFIPFCQWCTHRLEVHYYYE